MILDKLEKNNLKSYTSYELPFYYRVWKSFKTEKHKIKANIFRKGKDKINLYEIYTNGKTNWVYLKNTETIQITDIEPNKQ